MGKNFSLSVIFGWSGRSGTAVSNQLVIPVISRRVVVFWRHSQHSALINDILSLGLKSCCCGRGSDAALLAGSGGEPRREWEALLPGWGCDEGGVVFVRQKSDGIQTAWFVPPARLPQTIIFGDIKVAASCWENLASAPDTKCHPSVSISSPATSSDSTNTPVLIRLYPSPCVHRLHADRVTPVTRIQNTLGTVRHSNCCLLSRTGYTQNISQQVFNLLTPQERGGSLEQPGLSCATTSLRPLQLPEHSY